ncbi:helix-turn-helix domain-containing protein [Lentzea albidocapillata]|nr:helix-turn-helix transcriptional regulator [Lentzea albidocapillata]
MPRRVSTARRREFGDGLRAAIGATGLSSRAVAAMVGWHESKLSDLVQGKGGATELEVAILLGACRTPLPEREHLLALFRETHVKGWWQQHGACSPVRLRTAVGHLAVARSIVDWQAHVVPCFLQTADYAREVMRASVNIPTDELEERVAAQAEMQGLLRRVSHCTFFIHELALSLQVGSREVHVEQLQHLLFSGNRPSFSIRIVPAALGAHAGMNGSFTKLDFEKHEPIVWLQNENSSLFVEEESAVAGYGAVARRLHDVSLDAEQSKVMITQQGDATCLLR